MFQPFHHHLATKQQTRLIGRVAAVFIGYHMFVLTTVYVTEFSHAKHEQDPQWVSFYVTRNGNNRWAGSTGT